MILQILLFVCAASQCLLWYRYRQHRLTSVFPAWCWLLGSSVTLFAALRGFREWHATNTVEYVYAFVAVNAIWHVFRIIAALEVVQLANGVSRAEAVRHGLYIGLPLALVSLLVTILCASPTPTADVRIAFAQQLVIGTRGATTAMSLILGALLYGTVRLRVAKKLPDLPGEIIKHLTIAALYFEVEAARQIIGWFTRYAANPLRDAPNYAGAILTMWVCYKGWRAWGPPPKH